MRVTTMGTSTAMAARLMQAATRMETSTEQLATGRKLTTVADSPTDTATVLRYNAQQSALSAYKASAQDAQTWLAAADTALQSVSTAMSSALTTIQAGGSPAMDDGAREALAQTLEGISAQLFSLGNARSQDRAIFAGFSTQALSKDATGAVTFVGDQGQVARQVSANQSVTVNVSAQEVFGFAGAPGQDVFSMLSAAASALRAGDTRTAAGLHEQLSAAHTTALGALQRVGTTGNVVESAITAGEAERLTLTQARSALVDIDLAQATLDAQLTKLGYQAALTAAARADMPSLADYLR